MKTLIIQEIDAVLFSKYNYWLLIDGQEIDSCDSLEFIKMVIFFFSKQKHCLVLTNISRA